MKVLVQVRLHFWKLYWWWSLWTFIGYTLDTYEYSHSHIYEILNHLKYIYFTHMYTTCASRHSRLYEITHRHAHKHFHTDRYTYPRTYFLCLPLTWIFPERHAWIFQVKSPKIYNITPQQKLALIEKSFFFSWNLM